MTVTEDAPAAASAPPKPMTPTPAPATGLASLMGSGDHKAVGRLWIAAALVHLALAGTAAVLVAVEQIDLPGNQIIGTDWFGQYFAYRSIAGAFLFLVPLTIGVATAVVPLQLGAPTIAFPRAAAASAWGYVLGSGLIVGSFAIKGGPFGSDVDGVRLFVAAFAFVLISQIVAWICIATTVITMRVPGMSLARTPLFSWSNLVAASVWMLTLPVLLGVTVMAYLDIRYGEGGGFFGGGEQTLYARIAWVFSTPVVYAFAIPALGVIGSTIPVFSGVRHPRHRLAQGLIAAFGALSVGAWVMPGFGEDVSPWLYDVPWVAVSFAIVIPVIGLLGLWAFAAKQGRLTASSPLLFSLAAATMLLVGVLAGAVQAIKPIKTLVDTDATSLYGTTWSTAVASYVVLAAGIAMLGAVVYWAPKGIGSSFKEGPARVGAVLLLAGTVLWSFPALIAGLLGQPGSPGAAPTENVNTIEALNIATAVGGVLLALALIGFVIGLLGAVRSEELPGDDPWSGHTLEWATSSPPPFGNFASLPEVRSEAPLYDARNHEEGSA